MPEEKSTRASQERKTRFFFTHDQPIIIDNSSITLALDGDRSTSYHEVEPGHYRAPGHTVKFVTIDGRRCDFVPESGICTIRIGGHNTGGDNSPITIASAESGIDIVFDIRHYPRHNQTTENRKVHKTNERRVRTLIITNDETHEEHACNLPPHTTAFQIMVEDRDPKDVD